MVGYVCQGAMTKLWLLFQGWGEERVIGEGKGSRAAVYHTKSMHNNNQVRELRKLAGMQKDSWSSVIAKIKKQGLKMSKKRRGRRILFMSSLSKTPFLTFTNCQACNHNRVKCRRHKPNLLSYYKMCLFYARNTIGLWQLSPCFTLQPELLFIPYLSFNKSNYSSQSS